MLSDHPVVRLFGLSASALLLASSPGSASKGSPIDSAQAPCGEFDGNLCKTQHSCVEINPETKSCVSWVEYYYYYPK